MIVQTAASLCNVIDLELILLCHTVQDMRDGIVDRESSLGGMQWPRWHSKQRVRRTLAATTSSNTTDSDFESDELF